MSSRHPGQQRTGHDYRAPTGVAGGRRLARRRLRDGV